MPGNPVLNEKSFAPERVVAIDSSALAAGRRTTMSLDGVVQKTALLLALVVASGAVGWQLAPTSEGTVTIPLWALPAALAALGVALITFYRPHLARFTGPTYAVLEGLVAGTISAAYNARFNGIVVQAIGLTLAIAFGLLVLFATGRIKVTPRFQAIIITATFAILVVSLAQLALNLVFGASVPWLFSSGLIGTAFCLFVSFVAASNLLLDFNFIQRGIDGGAPRHMEWYAGFAVCVHLVWLYLEVLRLLGRFRSR